MANIPLASNVADVDETKTPKKKGPVATQQTQGGIGGNNTASDGATALQTTQAGGTRALGVPAEVLSQPLSQTLSNTAANIRQKGILGSAIEGGQTSLGEIGGQTTNYMKSLIQGGKNVLFGSGEQAPTAPTAPAAPATPEVASLNPSTPLTPDAATKPLNYFGGTQLNTDAGVKTLSGPQFQVSSTSPKLGNMTPGQVGSLDTTLAMNRNPDVIAHRAESARLADQRYADARTQSPSPNSSENLLKAYDEARASGNIGRASMMSQAYIHQLGNEASMANAKTQADSTSATSQNAQQRLGFDMTKSQAELGQARELKQSDQMIEAQKHNDQVTQNYANWVTDPAKGGMAPAATKFHVASQLGVVPDPVTTFGEEGAKRLSEQNTPQGIQTVLGELFNGDQAAIQLWIKAHQSK
jgi:hypothetical protein